MKTLVLTSLAALALATGCDSQTSTPAAQANTNQSGESVATAPVDYLSTVTKQQQNAVKKIDTVAVNQAIQLFQVQEGRNPKDLNELVAKKYIPQIPQTPHGTKLEYDATAGTVKVVNQ